MTIASLFRHVHNFVIERFPFRPPACLILGHRWMFLGICERCGAAHPSTKEKK